MGDKSYSPENVLNKTKHHKDWATVGSWAFGSGLAWFLIIGCMWLLSERKGIPFFFSFSLGYEPTTLPFPYYYGVENAMKNECRHGRVQDSKL
jgi:hypothetical protein